MDGVSYRERRGELETYFDRTAVEAWSRLTSDAPLGRIRETVAPVALGHFDAAAGLAGRQRHRRGPGHAAQKQAARKIRHMPCHDVSSSCSRWALISG